jgi:hypothetical protein
VKSNSDLFGGVFSQNCYLKNYEENLLQTPCCKIKSPNFQGKGLWRTNCPISTQIFSFGVVFHHYLGGKFSQFSTLTNMILIERTFVEKNGPNFLD